jgi:hypothetical protein
MQATQIFPYYRSSLWCEGHKWDGHENQNEDDYHQECQSAAGGVERGDLIQWLSVDTSQPEEERGP